MNTNNGQQSVPDPSARDEHQYGHTKNWSESSGETKLDSTYENKPGTSTYENQPGQLFRRSSIQSAKDNAKGGAKYWQSALLALMVAFGGFTFGYDTGTISGFVNMPNYINRFGSAGPTGAYVLTEVRTGLIVSIFNIGCAFGALFLSKVADSWGRKKGLMITMVVYIVGILIQITSLHVWAQYFVGRIISGLAVGSVSVICPMFISETAPKAIRGMLVSCYQLMVTAGIFVGYCICYGTYHNYTNSAQWRIPLGLCFLCALLVIFGMTLMPESPRYLASQGNEAEAMRSIAKINKAPVDSPEVINTYQEMKAGIDSERSAGNSSWMELIVGKPKIFYRIVVGILLQSLQQLSGCNYFFYYGTMIFKSVGLTDSFLTSIILGAVNFLSSFISLYTTDRFGRRKALMVGSAGMAIALVIFASIGVKLLYPAGWGTTASVPVGDAMIALSCIFIFFFAVTWGPCVFVVISEMFPLRIRSKGMGLTQAANWFWNFMIAFFTPYISDSIHFAYGYVFCGCNIFGFLLVYFCLPETKGLTLEEVDELYSRFEPGISPLKRETTLANLRKNNRGNLNYLEGKTGSGAGNGMSSGNNVGGPGDGMNTGNNMGGPGSPSYQPAQNSGAPPKEQGYNAV